MRIGLIAGGGQFPIIFAKKAKTQGFDVFAVAHNNETDPSLGDHAELMEWVHLGQINRIIKFFKRNHVTQAVMMGTITKTRIFSDIRPDLKAISLVAKMRHTLDDGFLRAIAGVMEEEGIRIESSTFLLPDLLAQTGCWTKRKPSGSEKNDFKLGWRVAKEIGRLDIGQCVVVGGGSVLAVEAIDGTDATILRGGKLAKRTGVVIKVCKPNQDTRFDIPAIGAQTIKTMHAAGTTALAMEAGRVVVFDKDEMVALADQYGIAVVALTSEEEI